jgi:divalent metal cation (Fe/Co/Zn/Cd) transporter
MESTTELMDGITDTELYKEVFCAIKTVEGAGNPHRVRIRQLGHLYAIGLDIEVDRDMTVSNAHQISQAVEKAIKERIDNIYDVVVHLEPSGNSEEQEAFGVNANNIDVNNDDGGNR